MRWFVKHTQSHLRFVSAPQVNPKYLHKITICNHNLRFVIKTNIFFMVVSMCFVVRMQQAHEAEGALGGKEQ